MGVDGKGLAREVAELRRLEEQRPQSKKPGVHRPLTDKEAHSLVHELEVHQVELEVQNAELRQTREQLEKALDRYADLNATLEVRISEAVCELRRKDQELLLKTRQAVMGEMIDNIAHQWRQPLNALGINIQEAQLRYQTEQFSQEFFRGNVAKSLELIQYMSRTIDDFKNFFRLDKESAAFDVNLMIARTLSLIEKSFQDQKIEIVLHAEADLTVEGYPNEYCHALLNLLMNSRDALVANVVDNARILIRAFSDGGKVVVAVTDQGGGIADEIMDKLFDPYFTTKGPEQGTGVGLFMAKSIVENMGGRLMARNAEGGAEFRIEI